MLGQASAHILGGCSEAAAPRGRWGALAPAGCGMALLNSSFITSLLRPLLWGFRELCVMLWQRSEGWGVQLSVPWAHPPSGCAELLEVGSASSLPLPFGYSFWWDAHTGDKFSLIFTSRCALFQAVKVKCAITLSACSAQKPNRDVPSELTLISVYLPSKAISPCSYGSQKLPRWR